MVKKRGHLMAQLLLVASWALLSSAAAFPDWTDCPIVCHCKWTSGKKSALCPDAGLTSLPDTLDSDMQVLDLSGNNIPILQADTFKYAGLLNLQRVFLRNAGIHEIHGDAFKDMRILVEVDLSDNHVTTLSIHTFSGNERLKQLVLSGNPLRVLKAYQFPMLQHLRILELQRCSLKQVHAASFQKLPALETLSLDNNELEYLEADTITSLKRLKTLGLDNNPWSCDCRLRDFSRILTIGSMNRLYSVPQTCISPARVQGRRWEEVKQFDFACEPTVLLPFSNIQEEMNGNVSLACLASGDPEPEVWWQLNGGPVNGTKRPSDEVGPPGGLVIYSTSLETHGRLVERWSNLTIYNASDADAGEYTCHARNIAGLAKDIVTVSIPRIFTAPTLSQTDNWLLWLSLAGGGTVALCVSATAVLIAMCLCGGARRRRRRAKVKLQASASFGDQEKKLLDLSVTTTATTTSQQHQQSNEQLTLSQAFASARQNHNNHQHHQHHHHYHQQIQQQQQQQQLQHNHHNQSSPPPIQADMNHCHRQPEFELDLEAHSVQDRMHGQSAANVTIERLRQQQQQQQQSECITPSPSPPVLCPVAVAPTVPANIYIAVSMAGLQEAHTQPPIQAVSAPPSEILCNSHQHQQQQQQVSTTHERCYPDLLDIGLSSFATLPRRTRRELGSPYDNMGPRITATGSSTFSLLEQPEPIAAAVPLIQPPPEFVSL